MARQAWRRRFAIIVLMLVFLVILCLSILLMYASIHPNGLVLFNAVSIRNTSVPSDDGNNNMTGVNKTTKDPSGHWRLGVTILPVDPWWIRLAEKDPVPISSEFSSREDIVDWDSRVRVKVANASVDKVLTTPRTAWGRSKHKARQPPPHHPITTSTPFSTTYRARPGVITDIPDDYYDENTIIYNYKSYENPVIRRMNQASKKKPSSTN